MVPRARVCVLINGWSPRSLLSYRAHILSSYLYPLVVQLLLGLDIISQAIFGDYLEGVWTHIVTLVA